MADIEPYKQIQKTNIKEHNDLVAKINEIIDVINNTNLDAVVPKITALENDVSTINATDSLQWTDIENLKDSQSAQDVTIGNMDTQVKGVTEALVSGIAIIDGITMGNMKVRVEREKATPIDSNDYNIQKPVSMELIQGSGPSTFKAQITLSDGTIIRSDDFMFTTEAIGTDVYISSFVFKNGNVAGTISADIGLSNGTTIEANNFAVPMDPSLLNTVQDLSTRLSAVEGGQVGGLDELKATVDSHTASISALDSDVANLMIDKVDVAQGVGNAGKVLGINSSGNVEPIEISSGGEVWEEVNLSNLPTDFVDGDRVKIEFIGHGQHSGGGAWSIAPTDAQIVAVETEHCNIGEFTINVNGTNCKFPIYGSASPVKHDELYVAAIFPPSYWNTGGIIIVLKYYAINGAGIAYTQKNVDRTEIKSFVKRMWRLKK